MKRGELLENMLVIMVNGHKGQFDRGNVPYALHPLAVMQILNTNDEELQCIALGHDLIEDTKVTWKELEEAGMTKRIMDGIRALTKMPGETYEEYKNKVFDNIDAMRVKQADITHNLDVRRLKGITQKDLDRNSRYQIFYTELEFHIRRITKISEETEKTKK